MINVVEGYFQKDDQVYDSFLGWIDIDKRMIDCPINSTWKVRRPSNSLCKLKSSYLCTLDLTAQQFERLVSNSNFISPVEFEIKTIKLYKILPESLAKKIHDYCKETGNYIQATNQGKNKKTFKDTWIYKNLKRGQSIEFCKMNSDDSIRVHIHSNGSGRINFISPNEVRYKEKIERIL